MRQPEDIGAKLVDPSLWSEDGTCSCLWDRMLCSGM